MKENSAKTKKIVGYVFTGIGIAVAVFLLIVLINLAVTKKKNGVPSVFGSSYMIVATGSMSGTIEDGDLIVVRKADDYKVGDIITFLPDGDTIPTTHRIINISDGKYYTKGDANNAADPRPIEKSNIVGKVTSTVPRIGLFFRWVKDELGWVYILAFVVVIVVGVVLLKQFSGKKKADNQ